jgi:hypothetical protein
MRTTPHGTKPRIANRRIASKLGLLHVFGALVAAAASGNAAAADASIPTYSAVYQVEYKGKDLGTSEFKVVYDTASDTYEFSSRTVAKGLLKLASPNPVVERSRFRVVDGRIRPVEFWFEDGSRKGEDNLHVEFDWQRRVAIVSGEGARREVALEDRTLDRGSMQVALMRDMIVAQRPGDYRLAGEDATQAYVFTDNGEAKIETGLGSLTTRSFTQQREGSSRSTWLWFASELSYLPARIEQRRDGEVQTAFRLASVTGLGGR